MTRRTDAEMVEHLLMKAGKIMERRGWMCLCGSGCSAEIVVQEAYFEHLEKHGNIQLLRHSDDYIKTVCPFPSDGGDPG